MPSPETARGVSDPRPFLVGIAGGSGSGKSTLVRALTALLGPDRVATLSQDAYYCDHGELPAAQRVTLTYDAPEALDIELFVEHLATLRARRPVRPPRYCFSTHRRVGADAPVEPRPVVLVDGVLLLHDPRVRALLDLTIFLDVPDATRVSRRSAGGVSEDHRTRRSGLSVHDAIVRGFHARYVEPTKALANLVLLNVGRLDHVAEIGAGVILDRVERRSREVAA
jgi:uridine kinase